MTSQVIKTDGQENFHIFMLKLLFILTYVDDKSLIIAGSLTGPVNWYRAAFSYPQSKKMGKITAPTLIVWGKPDLYLDEGMAPLASKYVDNLTVKCIEDSNHFVQMDRPDESNRLVREFLQS